MHSNNFAIFLFLLASSLLFTLPNNNSLSSVEARKFSTSNNGGVFKVDLIHRDSPYSPYYNPSMTQKQRLERSPFGYISRGHNIHLSSTYYNTSDVGVVSNLIPNGGGYLVKISIGTPKVDFLATADTGSDLIWVQCLPCDNCISKISPPFDPKKSSTFHEIPCNDAACSREDVKDTGCPTKTTIESSNSSPCNYEVQYGKGSTTGILAQDTISLPSSDTTSTSLSSSIFGCGISQTEIFDDGIVGLGTGQSSLISQLGQKINYKFSYCLPPLSLNTTGKLAFGADVTGSGVVSTPFTTGPNSHHYNLILNGVTVGDEDVTGQSNVDIIIDSGTTFTYLPDTVYGSIESALETALGPSTAPSPEGTGLRLCYTVDDQFKPPNMVFRFEGADVVLKADNIFFKIEEGVTCLAMVATNGIAIFGNVAQANYEVGYDLHANQVSFAPTNCANY